MGGTGEAARVPPKVQAQAWIGDKAFPTCYGLAGPFVRSKTKPASFLSISQENEVRIPNTGVNNQEQLTLPFGPIRNREFLSNHWLEHRLPLEREWRSTARPRQRGRPQKLIALWRVEKDRAEKYGDEQG